ncbi:FAD/FMN-containing isoamyl alcohol oxidase MreA [Usnea florida]
MFSPRLLVVVGLLNFHRRILASTTECRCYPAEPCWPSPSDWAALNTSVGGRLIATVPLGSPCHDPTYNATVCKTLQENWVWPQEHYMSSSSVMSPFYANQSCDPYTPESRPCTLGNYVDYAINVTERADIAQGIAFATNHNIRLVIRNTGHDYFGKSTGAFSLALWTHHLKNISFSTHTSPSYTGQTITLGAGVQGFEAYAAAHAHGLAVTAGECQTVGVAGGYTQGGGHSALASRYGLAADQALEWEVVTGTGEVVTASETVNSDLFWALAGGGGGTYGVVWSLTARAHPDGGVSGANLTFGSEAVGKDVFYEAVTAWHENLPRLVDEGATTVYYVSSDAFTLTPFTGPGISAQRAGALLRPFLDALDALGITYNMTGPMDFPSFLDQYNTFQLPLEVSTAQYGGRLIPRSVVEGNASALTAAIRTINEQASAPLFIGVGLNVNGSVVGDVGNAVLPAWRDTLVHAVLTTPWNFTAPLEDMVRLQAEMTNVLVPQLEAITPGSGCYLNEGDPYQPDWQETFYGVNYPRLRAIKAKYDPNDIFYGTTAVGSDEWELESPGRLCKVST